MTLNDFNLNVILDMPIDDESPIYQIESAEFSEHVIELGELAEALTESEMFTEAKVDHVKGSLSRTKELTTQAMQAYNNVTTGVGDVMHGGATLSLKLINLAAKVTKFACKMIAAIPLITTKLITDLAQVTSRAFMEITGEMQIYLTDSSLDLFDKEVKQEIKHFIDVCSLFSAEGDWTVGLFSDDFKRYKQLKSIYWKLNGIRYEPTVIKLDTPHARSVYFNPNSVYYSRLGELNQFFIKQKPELERLGAALETKVANSENTGNYYKLNAAQQLKVRDSIQMVSSFMSIVGKYFKYVQEDLLTIKTHTKRQKSPATDKAPGEKPKAKPVGTAKHNTSDGT